MVTIKLSGLSAPLCCRFNNSDISVLLQTFGDQQWHAELPFAPRTILDVGANVGYVSAYLAAKFPAARILAVEPHSENCRLFKRNCAHFRNVTLLIGAIWHTRSQLRISDPHARPWEIKVEEVTDHNAASVVAYTMQDLLNLSGSGGFDIVKLDIEGAEEALLLHSDVSWLKSVRCLIVEVHKSELVPRMQAVMNRWGFSAHLRGEKLSFCKIAQRSSTVVTTASA